MNDEQLKDQLRRDAGVSDVKKGQPVDFPTEIITLPSKGYFYPEDSPLAEGTIEMKYPTAREEDILTSRNLISKGIVLDKFFESIIVSPIDYNTLLLGDKTGIMVAARILAYGPKYEFDYDCPKCNETNKSVEADLTLMQTKEIDFEQYTQYQQEFELQLPVSNKKVKFKLLTHADSKKIDNELKGFKKLGSNREITTRLKHALVEVDGERDLSKIAKFVETMLTQDSRELRAAIAEATPDIDLEFNFECSECGYSNDAETLPLGPSFFYPSGRL